MEAVCLLGSPRRGNSERMASWLVQSLAESGVSLTTHRLAGLDYSGCRACFGCKGKSESCVVEDDLFVVLEDVRRCPILVLASPVYFGDVSAQIKGFIDRSFSFLVPDYPTAKRKTRLTGKRSMVMLLSQGHGKADLFADIFPRYAYFFKWLGFEECHMVRACGVYEPGAVDGRDDIRQECSNLAEILVKAHGAGGRSLRPES